MSNTNLLLQKALAKLRPDIPIDIVEAANYHFDGRKRVWPTTEDGLLWMVTEIAETFELVSARKSYIRNNPENKEQFTKERFAEELGDVIYMAIVTGLVEGVNPIEAMFNKMKNQINEELEK